MAAVETLEPVAPARSARVQAVTGLVATALTAVLVGYLHVAPPSADLNPVRRTISQYALLETGWIFNLAVLGLAAGSVATLGALVGARLATLTSAGSVAMLLWTVGLVGVVMFPKHNWALGPSMTGDIHRAASLLAFLSLPAAALLLARAWLRHPVWRLHARLTCWLGVVSYLCFAPIAIAIALQPVTGIRWWRAVPLGAVERALALAEVITVLVLAWWAARAARRRTA